MVRGEGGAAYAEGLKEPANNERGELREPTNQKWGKPQGPASKRGKVQEPVYNYMDSSQTTSINKDSSPKIQKVACRTIKNPRTPSVILLAA